MRFARKIIESEKLIDLIDLPDELRQSKVEVIVLPIDDDAEVNTKNKTGEENFIETLMDHPRTIAGFKPLTRDEIY